MALYDSSDQWYSHDPGLIFDDIQLAPLGNAQLFVYASAEDAQADARRLPVRSMAGLSLIALSSNPEGFSPRFQTTVIAGIIRAGDNYQETLSATGLALAVSDHGSRIAYLEQYGAGLGTAPGSGGSTGSLDPNTDTNVDLGEYAFGDAPFGN